MGQPNGISLSEVSISLEHETWGDRTTITLSGKGTGERVRRTVEDETTTTSIAVEPKEVFALLEYCFKERFFHLAASYGVSDSVRLDPGGKLLFSSVTISDATTETITVQLGAYKKSVSFLRDEGDPPPALLELSKRITGISERLVPP